MTDHLDRAAAIVGGCCSHCDDLVYERLALLDEAGLLVASKVDLSVDIEATATGQRCTVKCMGVTLFRGVSLEATLTTEAHDRQVAAKALREAADDVYASSGEGQWPKPSVIAYLRDRADRIGREAGES